MRKSWLSIFIIPVVVIVGLFFFKGCDNAPRKKPAPEVELKDVRVYVDTSVSMRGYFRAQPQAGTMLQRFIWEGFTLGLREVLTEENIYLVTFGSDIDDPVELGPAETFLKRFRFKLKQDIDAMFADADTKLVELFDSKAIAEDRLFVIVTDGLPSAPDGSGPDPRIKKVIKKKILDKGLHLWLIGLRSEFRGTVYPETPGKDGIKRNFHYNGVRPVYIWVGSKNIKEGNAVVYEFTNKLKRMIKEEGNEKLAVELIEFPRIELSKAELSLSKVDINGEPIRKVSIVPRDDYTVVRVSKMLIGDLSIPLVTEWKEGKMNYKLEYSFNYEEKIWQMNDRNTWALTLKSGRIPKRMHIVMNVAPKTDKWWEAWSTDNNSSRESADKTLYLKNIVEDMYESNEIEAGRLELRFE